MLVPLAAINVDCISTQIEDMNGLRTAESNRLKGEGCLMPGIKGIALRNMTFSGTAYDDLVVSCHRRFASYSSLVCKLTKT